MPTLLSSQPLPTLLREQESRALKSRVEQLEEQAVSFRRRHTRSGPAAQARPTGSDRATAPGQRLPRTAWPLSGFA